MLFEWYNLTMRTVLETVILPIIVVCIGLSAGFGYIFNSPNIIEFARASGASPLPLPFADIQGKQENFSYSGTIEYQSESGQVVQVPIRTIDLQGPHRRIITYVTALHVWSQATPMSAAVLVSGFCNFDRKLFAAPVTTEPRFVTLSLKHNRTGSVFTQSAKMVCPR